MSIEKAQFGEILSSESRNQLEPYIAEKLGPEHLTNKKTQAELRAINKEIVEIKRRLAVLEGRKAELGRAIKR